MHSHCAIILMYLWYILSIIRFSHVPVLLFLQELRDSEKREARLEKALRKASLVKLRLKQQEQEFISAQSRYIRTLSSLEQTQQQELVAIDELEAQLSTERSEAQAHLERAQTDIQSLQREVRVCIVQQNETVHHVCVQCICAVCLKNEEN